MSVLRYIVVRLVSTQDTMQWTTPLFLLSLLGLITLLDFVLAKLKGWKYLLSDNKSLRPSKEDDLQEKLCWLGNTNLAVRANNRRTGTLKAVYRLNNPFTSDSDAMQSAYRSALMQNFKSHCAESWDGIGKTVAASIQTLITHGKGEISCNIKDISRRAALAACLKSLFDIDNVDPIRLDYIGVEIHRLMVGKKNFDKGASSEDDMAKMANDLHSGADRLVNNLKDLFKDAKYSSPLARSILCEVSGTDTQFNPLNLIVPAFEAPWRSVHYTVLAILQQQNYDRCKDIESIRDRETASTFPPRALAVAYESLRLYPPIRRVRREIQVDIEVIQRHPKYWGSRSLEWDPTRFLCDDGSINNRLTRQNAAWMPFAIGSMKCPSASGYSVRMLILTVGEILKEMIPQGSMGWRLEGPEWDTSDMSGQPLRPGRDEYASVHLFTQKQ